MNTQINPIKYPEFVDRIEDSQLRSFAKTQHRLMIRAQKALGRIKRKNQSLLPGVCDKLAIISRTHLAPEVAHFTAAQKIIGKLAKDHGFRRVDYLRLKACVLYLENLAMNFRAVTRQ